MMAERIIASSLRWIAFLFGALGVFFSVNFLSDQDFPWYISLLTPALVWIALDKRVEAFFEQRKKKKTT